MERNEVVEICNQFVVKLGVSNYVMAKSAIFDPTLNAWRIKMVKRLNKKAVLGYVTVCNQNGDILNVTVGVTDYINRRLGR